MIWLPPAIRPIFLLLISNFFMTFAWYGHLKFTDRPLWLVVVASWSIAFVETSALQKGTGRQVTYVTRLGVKIYVLPPGLTKEGEVEDIFPAIAEQVLNG